ncbi:putative hemolysin [Kibdelosporangium banguiense]|uniref:Hemolysin n=1 Tax=Kibdelosporangium banguiense TaxID=1365924 RepID=A0ABS4TX45_9PSEU|nr:hypothetical protein [Kibdelosporangium banguiense]MBP2328983.1 putative hemolysin [Kibdelosporangium banguiense]
MLRKSTIGFCSLTAILFAGLLSGATAGAETPGPAASQSDKSWCAAKGGKAIDYSPWANTNYTPVRLGGRFTMCDFTDKKEQTTITVSADSLAADEPTLAALAYTFKPQKPPSTGGENPADDYCVKLGGAVQFGANPSDVGGWAPSSQKEPTEFAGMCVFADRSMIDSWGLFYHLNGVIRGADLTGKWKATMPVR